jgi:hypothetical protein
MAVVWWLAAFGFVLIACWFGLLVWTSGLGR